MCSNHCGFGVQHRKIICDTNQDIDKCRGFAEEERNCIGTSLCNLGTIQISKFNYLFIRTYAVFMRIHEKQIYLISPLDVVAIVQGNNKELVFKHSPSIGYCNFLVRMFSDQ